MSPFDKYAKTLSYFLPARMRDEVVREVMSNLYEELEAEAKTDQEGDREQMMKRILTRKPPARALAGSFVEKRHELIGGRVYPVYKWTLWASLITTLITISSLSLMDGFRWEMLGELAISSVVVFTIITLIFVAIDQLEPLRHVAESMSMIRTQEFTQVKTAVLDVTNLPPRYRLHRRVLAIVLLFCLNVVPDQVGLVMLISEPHFRVSTYPILSLQFLGVPRLVISAWCVTIILVDAFLAWKKSSRFELMTDMFLQCAGLLVGLFLLINGHIFAIPHPAQVASYPNDLRIAMNTVVAPPLFQSLMIIFWLGWLARAWGFFQRFRLHVLSSVL
ncbi:hypothetical protein EO087_09645 [Dyella sp. M7H15-1]|uniref:hypothetical protein n=1 Tax=Dyella sp. M7H15-1 TaxID=2501295 RepID=UPI001004F3DF|nr:hypothetical protein [Dyella sp. M7H15-1]QAU24218.1 hypothetical protein EO087_09645 [Dyella sp. M7H15-1]